MQRRTNYECFSQMFQLKLINLLSTDFLTNSRQSPGISLIDDSKHFSQF